VSGPDRYEPMPGITRLPGFLWRKLPRAGKVVVAAIGVAAVAAVAISIPFIVAGKEEGRQRELSEAAKAREARGAELRRLVAPRTLTVTPVDTPSAPIPERTAARRAALLKVQAGIVADARRRESRRIRTARCERIPSTDPPPAGDLSAARVRVACVAVTSELAANERTTGSTLGYPYIALVDFRSGRVGFCRTVHQAGEGGYTSSLDVATPAACGG
jgi:hypothetical protein